MILLLELQFGRNHNLSFVFLIFVFAVAASVTGLCPRIDHLNPFDLPHSHLHAIMRVLRVRAKTANCIT
jgi:hypothetical protein